MRQNFNYEGETLTKKQIHIYALKTHQFKGWGEGEASVLNSPGLNQLDYFNSKKKKIQLTEVTWWIVGKISVEFSPMSLL